MTRISDISILGFVALQFIGVYWGSYRENALLYGIGVATSSNLYFICRCRGGLSSNLFRYLAIGASVLGLGLSLVYVPLTIARLLAWKQLQLRWSTIIRFRYVFFLPGGPAKIDCLTLVLALLPFSLIVLSSERSRLFRSVAILSSIGAIGTIAMGMSRGVYLGCTALSFSVLGVSKIRKVKLDPAVRNLLVASGLLMVVTMCTYTFLDGHLGLAVLSHATSTGRSVEGRFLIWRKTVSDIEGHPLGGVGGYNSALCALQRRMIEPYEPFVPRTFNWLLEVLVQNGVLGAATFCTIIACTFISGWHIVRGTSTNPHTTKTIAVLALGAIISILVSDLTFDSLVVYTPVMFVFFVLAGALNEGQPGHFTRLGVNPSRTIVSFGIVVLMLTNFYFVFWGLRRTYSELEHAEALTMLRGRDYNNALHHLTIAERYSWWDALYASMEGLVLERSAVDGQKFSELWRRRTMLPEHRQKQIQEALCAYQRASSMVPMDAAFHNNLGWLYAIQGDEKNAREQINIATRTDPGNALYHTSSGLLYERNGAFDRAYGEYSEAIACSPKILDSEFFAHLRLRHKDAIPLIIVHAEAIIRGIPDPLIEKAKLAKILYQEQDYLTARTNLLEVLRRLPTFSYAWCTLGSIREKEGNLQDAIMDYRRALFTDPTNKVALMSLASADQETGRYQEGLGTAELALMTEVPSEHATWSGIYCTQLIIADDVVPSGMLNYIHPKVNVDKLCGMVYDMSGNLGVRVPLGIEEKCSHLH